MNNRTKSFLSDLADLLAKHDVEISFTESGGYDSYTVGLEFESAYNEAFTPDMERVECVEIRLNNSGTVESRDVTKVLEEVK